MEKLALALKNTIPIRLFHKGMAGKSLKVSKKAVSRLS